MSDAMHERPLTQNHHAPTARPCRPARSTSSAGGYPAPCARRCAMAPAEVIGRREDAGPARPRRRRLPHRHEVALRAHGRRRAAAEVPRRQRRRDGAGHVQGPAAAGRRPAPADRGHDHRAPTPSRPTSPTSSCAASTRWPRSGFTRAIAEAYAGGLPGPEHPRHRASSLELLPAHERRPLHVRRGDRRCSNALEGKRANPRAKPPFPQVSGLWGKPTIVNNVETLCNVPHIVAQRAPTGSRA